MYFIIDVNFSTYKLFSLKDSVVKRHEPTDMALQKLLLLLLLLLLLYLSNVGLQLFRVCERLSFLKAYLVFNKDMLSNKLSNYKQDYVIRN